MMTALSYIGAHWELIIAVLLVTIAMSYVAFVLKNWKVAAAALLFVGASLAYQWIDIHGYKRRLAEEQAQQVAVLTERIATLSLVNSLDTQRAIADAASHRNLEALSSDTPPNPGPCLDAGAAHRVWAIRHSPLSLAAPLPTRRVSGVFHWRLRKPGPRPDAG
jgi:hypothetical protein